MCGGGGGVMRDDGVATKGKARELLCEGEAMLTSRSVEEVTNDSHHNRKPRIGIWELGRAIPAQARWASGRVELCRPSTARWSCHAIPGHGTTRLQRGPSMA